MVNLLKIYRTEQNFTGHVLRSCGFRESLLMHTMECPACMGAILLRKVHHVPTTTLYEAALRHMYNNLCPVYIFLSNFFVRHWNRYFTPWWQIFLIYFAQVNIHMPNVSSVERMDIFRSSVQTTQEDSIPMVNKKWIHTVTRPYHFSSTYSIIFCSIEINLCISYDFLYRWLLQILWIGGTLHEQLSRNVETARWIFSLQVDSIK